MCSGTWRAASLAAALAAVSALPGCGGGTDAVRVYVGYADSDAAGVARAFPSPWAGSPRVRFVGAPHPASAGAIRIDNPTGVSVTVNSVRVGVGGREWSMWGSQTVPPRSMLILTETGSAEGRFDTAAAAGRPCLDPGNEVPRIWLSVGGRTVELRDTGRVLTTGGRDLADCAGRPNKSRQWTSLGSVPLAPPVAPGAAPVDEVVNQLAVLVAVLPLMLGTVVLLARVAAFGWPRGRTGLRAT